MLRVFIPPAQNPGTKFPNFGVASASSVFERLDASSKRDVGEIDESFNSFKRQHGKRYTSDREHFERSHIYRANQHYVEAMNRRKLTYCLKLNHLADSKPNERTIMCGLKHTAESMPPPGAVELKLISASNAVPTACD